MAWALVLGCVTDAAAKLATPDTVYHPGKLFLCLVVVSGGGQFHLEHDDMSQGVDRQ